MINRKIQNVQSRFVRFSLEIMAYVRGFIVPKKSGFIGNQKNRPGPPMMSGAAYFAPALVVDLDGPEPYYTVTCRP